MKQNDSERIYSILNRQSKRKVRTARQILPKMRVPITDMSQYEKISVATNCVSSIIQSARKTKEGELQQWIDDTNPGPFQILKRISEISLPHNNALTKITSELEEIVSTPLPPTKEIESTKILKGKLADILIESHDIQISISDKLDKEKELKKKLELAKQERDAAKLKFEDYLRIMKDESFGEFETIKKIKEEKKEMEEFKKTDKNRQKTAVEFSQLWGESRHLRDEITKVSDSLAENRSFHEKFACLMAKKEIGSKEEYQKVEILKDSKELQDDTTLPDCF